ncbi:MAG: type II toxin-antitoxin system Phd/YefM family antitoxin [Thermoanaerobaculia bacterium]
MRSAGVREARQNLSRLLERLGREGDIVITDHGRPVARLAPLRRGLGKPFSSLAAFRRSMPRLRPPLSVSLIDDRDDRL